MYLFETAFTYTCISVYNKEDAEKKTRIVCPKYTLIPKLQKWYPYYPYNGFYALHQLTAPPHQSSHSHTPAYSDSPNSVTARQQSNSPEHQPNYYIHQALTRSSMPDNTGSPPRGPANRYSPNHLRLWWSDSRRETLSSSIRQSRRVLVWWSCQRWGGAWCSL